MASCGSMTLGAKKGPPAVGGPSLGRKRPMKGMVYIQGRAEECLSDFAADCSYLLDLHD
jgi:hypothetical protein